MEMIGYLGAVGIWGFSFGLLIFGTWLLISKFSGSVPDTPHHLLVPITILKPLKGLDPGIRENLETFFQLDYPKFELLFSIDNDKDPVRPILEDLMRAYPKVSARLFVSSEIIGANPKINNLLPSYNAATYDWILISDANVRVYPTYLNVLAGHLGERVGVASAVVVGIEPLEFGGYVETAYLNTFLARNTMMAFVFRRPVVIGKSMCFRKSLADQFGGLRFLGQYLAEDYMLGESVNKMKYPPVIMRRPIEQYVGRYALSTFWSRHKRWGRLRKAHAPFWFLLEPMGSSVASGVVGAVGWQGLLGESSTVLVSFLAIHFGIWMLHDFMQMKFLSKRFEVRSIMGWVVREILAFPLWVDTAMGDTVRWQGHKLRLRRGGTVEEIK